MAANALLLDKATLLLPFRDARANIQSLRVGVVLSSCRSSRWVQALLQFLRDIPGIHLQIVLVANPSLEHSWERGWLWDRVYSASRQRFDPYSELELQTGELKSIQTVTLDEIGTMGCDILIWLAPGRDDKTDLLSVSKYGAFTIQLGVGETLIPFWEEVANSQPTTTVTIRWHDTFLGSGRVVRKAETSTVAGLYFTSNAEEPLVAVIRMLGSLCLAMQEEGQRCVTQFRTIPEQPVERPGAPRFPSTLATAQFVSNKLARSVYMRWTRRGHDPKWFIAARPNVGSSIADQGGNALCGFNAIPLPGGSKEIADPFLWEADGRAWLLFEDIPTGSSRGRLACVELLKDGSWAGMELMLERDYHLSYPCVVPRKGELFLLPESSEARQIQLYRIVSFPSKVELVSLLAEDIAAVDTTPILLNDLWYFFTTTAAPFMETLLFWSVRLDGRWHLHPASPISSSVRNSRSAGHLFWKNSRLFRPTQDCSVRYGYAITLNEVVRLTPTEFEELPVQWIPPSWMPGLLGTHTWNESNQWQVVDGLR